MIEKEGCAILSRTFRAAGLTVQEPYPLTEWGLNVSLDGFDPVRRVGYEFITTEAGDRTEFPPDVVARLEDHMAAGELAVLLIDELETTSEQDLVAAAEAFLDHLRREGRL